MRQDYKKYKLEEKDVNSNPIFQFEKWFTEAKEAHINEPYAMTLATADKQGKPSARIVLMRQFDEKGFVFYTNYESRKGIEIMENPNASLLFFWQNMERQVRIEGSLQKVSAAESDLYFQSRPRESKLGAWVSEQSKIITDRTILDEGFKKLSEKYPDDYVR